ncbi:MAG: lysophospholipid acyltransferase family protein [Candidatus Ratteibacteria bacterium]|jgi:KDO2-lipid IV(A) lauroyltransferase
MEYILYQIACFLSARLPLGTLRLISFIAAMMKYLCLPGLRRIITSNLRAVFEYRKEVLGKNYSAQELRSAVRRVYRNFGFYIADFFYAHRWTLSEIERKVRISGRNVLDNACKSGKGVIVLTAHLGNWELAGIATAMLGYPMNAIALLYKNRKITSIFTKKREEKGVHVIFTGTSPKELLKVFHGNGIVAVLGDRLFTEKGVEVDFLGRKTLLPRGPATFAVRKETGFIAGFLVREGKGFHLMFEEIPPPSDLLSEDEKIQAFVVNGAKIIEKYVMNYPDQWLNFSRMWEC